MTHRVGVVSTVLLALAAVATAWSGYQFGTSIWIATSPVSVAV